MPPGQPPQVEPDYGSMAGPPSKVEFLYHGDTRRERHMGENVGRNWSNPIGSRTFYLSPKPDDFRLTKGSNDAKEIQML